MRDLDPISSEQKTITLSALSSSNQASIMTWSQYSHAGKIMSVIRTDSSRSSTTNL
jgi:hypothetical protein